MIDVYFITIFLLFSFQSLSEHGPNLILQYGIARTATTLQFQILCLMMAFLHEDEVQFVGCSHHKQKEKKYNVIKTHVISEFLNTNLPSNTWIFMTSNSSFSENKKASVSRNIQKIEAKNLRIPLIADVNSVLEQGYLIVYEYQAIFGMPDDKMKHIVEYIQYWDVLRVCCGTQMSAHWRNYLFTRSQHRQNKRLTKPECHLYNIAEVEKNLIETYAFRKFAVVIEAIGKLSVVDGKLDGIYCERCNDNIAKKHLKFNEKCT